MTATDATGMTEYLVTEGSSIPSASTAGWSATKPASYTFANRSSAGVKRLYAWAKDEVGNISASVSRPVTITAPPDRDRDGDDDDGDDD